MKNIFFNINHFIKYSELAWLVFGPIGVSVLPYDAAGGMYWPLLPAVLPHSASSRDLSH